MAEYIEREALMKNFCGYDLTKCVKYGKESEEQQHDSYSTMMMYEIADEIEDAPTIDAVPVVRCRDCFYYTPVNDKIGKCVFLIGEHQYVVPDGYCYLGERKEGADNG